MQTVTEIRQMLEAHGLSPNKRYGQNFFIDQNLLGKLLELAALTGSETVLEVGPGTGTLTEELLARSAKVVASEIDYGFCRLLRTRLAGAGNFVLVEGDVLKGKHAIAPAVLEQLGGRAVLVSNLPYNIATPLVAQCLISSWHASRAASPGGCFFDRLVFTVQREVGERMTASCDSGAYGPISVIVAMLGKAAEGPLVPATAFWPRPNIVSQMIRIDCDPGTGRVKNLDALTRVLGAAFGRRRKQIATALRSQLSNCPEELLQSSLAQAGIAPSQRAETVNPDQFLALANALAGGPASPGDLQPDY